MPRIEIPKLGDVLATVEPTPQTVVLRTKRGSIKLPAPVESTDAVSLGYLEPELALLPKAVTTTVDEAANSGVMVIGAVVTERVFVTSIELRALSAITADLTYTEITAAGVLTFIDELAGLREHFLAPGSSVAWVGSQILDVGDEIEIDLVGTGITPVDFEVLISFRALLPGGWIEV